MKELVCSEVSAVAVVDHGDQSVPVSTVTSMTWRRYQSWVKAGVVVFEDCA